MDHPLPPDICRKIDEFRSMPAETEWFEFNCDHVSPDSIGEYLSALSNAAALVRRPCGYLVYGIEDQTHRVVGTKLRPATEKSKNGPLENWLAINLEPRVGFMVHEGRYHDHHVVVFEVAAARERPIEYRREAYIRVGSAKKLLREHPDKERQLWTVRDDWSAQACPRARLDQLDPEAMAKARANFRMKQADAHVAAEVDGWDDAKFVAKAHLTNDGALTNAAVLLLGKPESAALLSPMQALLWWSLKKADGGDENFEGFGPPFLLAVDRLVARLRNLRVRFLPDGTLFPVELDQYDGWVLREALHNAIAHQDYALHSRIVVVEKPDELVIVNAGSFIPGSVEEVIRTDAPPRYYRNPLLCQAMVNLRMIETQGGGIRRMFLTQKQRFFPLPEYDLSRPDELRLTIPGRILDERYTRLLHAHPELPLETTMLLDRVQRRIPISREQYDFLRKNRLVEGRWTSFHLAAKVADLSDRKADYIKRRGLDTRHYEGLVIEYLRQFGGASRKELDELLLDKLPEVLTPVQKAHRIHNLLARLRDSKTIVNRGTRNAPRWVLVGFDRTGGD